MSEKYIELKPQIVSDYALVGATAVQGGVGIALEWLDRHPGQVPGRTITESELEEAKRFAKHHGIRPMLHRHFGLTVVPDPKPTNAEQVTADLESWGISRAKALELGPWLAGQGWAKAPGGDDEH